MCVYVHVDVIVYYFFFLCVMDAFSVYAYVSKLFTSCLSNRSSNCSQIVQKLFSFVWFPGTFGSNQGGLLIHNLALEIVVCLEFLIMIWYGYMSV